MKEDIISPEKLIKGAGRRGGGGGSPPPPPPPPPPHTPIEGLEGINIEGSKKLSRTETEVCDLISEGPIEGLVSGNYNYVGTIGKIGWNQVQFSPFAGSKPFLRSVYWKNVPVIDDGGNFNYTSVNFSGDFGQQKSAGFLQSNLSTPTNTFDSLPFASRSLNINEPLRQGSSFKKIYDLRSKNINKIILTIKVDVLYDQQNDPNLDRQDYPGGYKQSTTIGDIRDHTISYNFKVYKMTSSASGNTVTKVIDRNDSSVGKITQGFLHRFDFDVSQFYNLDTENASFIGWRLEVTRLSTESPKINIRDMASIHSITEIFAEKFIYPKVAIFRSLFGTDYFSSVPPRAYDTKLLKVKIPSNYDPIKKTYDGDWNGNFSDVQHPSGVGLYWTDNPAWIYYDLITNQRYGLGKYISAVDLDKWGLYQIAQYCDTIVEGSIDSVGRDANGGYCEARFTCNAIINDFSDAYTLINDFASIFRGLSYYANGLIYATSDMPREAYTLYNNSNVENGEFTYASSSRKVRNTVAVIRFNDSTNYSRPTVEYCEDPEGIRKYGIRKLEMSAFGCTSRGQAYRLGKWALISEQLESETINFAAGFDALSLRPGDIIKIQDRNRTIDRLGGRVLGIKTTPNSHEFILDQPFNDLTGYLNTIGASKYKFNILTPTSRTTGNFYSDFLTGSIRSEIQTGLFSVNNITGVSGFNPIPDSKITRITCEKLFDTNEYILSTGAVWTIEQTGKATSYFMTPETEFFKVINLTEIDKYKISVNAIEHNPSKYNAIESGLSAAEPDSSFVPGVVTILDAGTPSSLNLITNVNDLRISGVIGAQAEPTSGPGARETFYWKIFSKTGTNFIGGDLVTNFTNSNGNTVQVPKEDFLIGNSSVTFPTTSFGIDATNQIYFFRVYGVNSYGFISSSFIANNINFSSTFLDDLTNLINLGSFKYGTENDGVQSVAAPPAVNTFNDVGMSLSWKIINLFPNVKTWNPGELTYRIDYITGDTFDEQFIFKTQITGFPDLLSPTTASYSLYENVTTPPYSSGLGIFSGLVDLTGFLIAIDAQTGLNGKFTSQLTSASNRFTNPNGFLVGRFGNPIPILDTKPSAPEEGYSVENLTIDAQNKPAFTLEGLDVPDVGGVFIYYTEIDSGKLDKSYINEILQESKSNLSKSFISGLFSSGIQVCEADRNGDNFESNQSFINQTQPGSPIKSGYIIYNGFDAFRNLLMNSSNVGRSYQGGLSDTFYKHPNGGAFTLTDIQENRKLIDVLLQATGLGPPLPVTGALADIFNKQEILNMSGFLQSQIDTLSGNLIETGENLRSRISVLSGIVGSIGQAVSGISGSLVTISGGFLDISGGFVNLSGAAVLKTGQNNLSGSYNLANGFSSQINFGTGTNDIYLYGSSGNICFDSASGKVFSLNSYASGSLFSVAKYAGLPLIDIYENTINLGYGISPNENSGFINIRENVNVSGTGIFKSVNIIDDTYTNASAGSFPLPANTVGFMPFYISGILYKVPFYNL